MIAVGSNFPLGLDYSASLGGSDDTLVAGVDSAGSVYLLQTADTSTLTPTTVLGSPVTRSSYVTKLSPDGGRVAYITILGFTASAMAVDSGGSVYVAGPSLVAKLDPLGGAFRYQIPVAPGSLLTGIGIDNAGHAFVTGYTGLTPLLTTANAFQKTANGPRHAFAVKINAAGTGFDYATYIAGSGTDHGLAIAVDSSGEVFVAGTTFSSDFPITPGAYNSTAPAAAGDEFPFLARLASDGSSLIYSTFTGSDAFTRPVAVAVTVEGSAVVSQTGLRNPAVLRFNPTGTALEFSTILPASTGLGMLAVDAQGNAYATGSTGSANLPVRNSLATCDSSSVFLRVFDPAGTILQSTYVPGAFPGPTFGPAAALEPNGTVYLAGQASAGFVPTHQIFGLSGTGRFLMRFSSSSVPQTVRLACLGNSGDFATGAVAPGEIVSIFGQGLGPSVGVTPTVSLQESFPTGLAGVSATFDGIPAPLLYVQDGQMNTVVPWGLATGATTNICASYAGVNSNCIARTVSAAAPGVFFSDGIYAAAVNQDGTINSAANPAPAGSIVSIFATGLGQVTPMPTDGAITTLPPGTNILPAKIEMFAGGIQFFLIPIDPQYAGPAPFEAAGVSQINFKCAGFNQLYLVSVGPGIYSASFRIHVADN